MNLKRTIMRELKALAWIVAWVLFGLALFFLITSLSPYDDAISLFIGRIVSFILFLFVLAHVGHGYHTAIRRLFDDHLFK
jgi:hypothetical protein